MVQGASAWIEYPGQRMRARLPLCRGVAILLLAGVTLLTTNVLFLWNQLQDAHELKCVCDCSDGDTKRISHSNTVSSTESMKFLNATIIVSSLIDATQREATASHSETAPPSIPPRVSNETDERTNPHQLAVVVPFRNRFEELLEFAPHIHSFLTRQKVRHQIWIVNQADKHRFNRASLLNVGFLLSRKECDYIAMHDIDLLPLNDDLQYSFPNAGPLHVSAPALHPLYHYKTFVGGILIMSRGQFEKVNGLSNLFWGWGREDDELYVRMQEARMKVQYPEGITTGYNTFKHIHDRVARPRDQRRYFNQHEMSRKRDRNTGLSTLKYEVVSDIEMTIAGAPLHFVNVKLECDYKVTPFCDAPS